MDWEEACNILGVQQTASPDEIDAQYRIKAFLLHPDHTRDYPEAVRKKATEEFILVQKAYELLKVPSNNPISNPPKLKIEPMRIRFKDMEIGEKKSTTFQITNVGGAYTNIWIDNQLAPWLSVAAAKSTGAEQLPLEVTIECNGVGEKGKHDSCTLLVKLENEKTHIKDEVNVEVELWMKEGAEEITPDVVPSVLTQQVKQVQRGFSFGTFLGTVMAFGIGGLFGGLILYGILAESLIGLWWFILIIYVGITLFYAIKAGIKEGTQVIVVSPWSPPPFNPTPPPPPYQSPQVVVNKFSSTCHRPSCEWAKKISYHNRSYMTKDEAIQRGFKSCKVCRP